MKNKRYKVYDVWINIEKDYVWLSCYEPMEHELNQRLRDR